ncbi:aminoglycoside phosphotransferase family protein [Planktotalea sp.]|uniref:aminoglycoside phosphotransferase family protein n=1 Tax=Planktotalea sp. TaxID=2029877 RepID=UPI003299AD53
MSASQQLSEDVLSQFNLSSASLLEETPIAFLWKVQRTSAGWAVLKVYKKTDMGNEAPGFIYLAEAKGKGAAHVYQTTRTCALMEWLEGPSLGDFARGGEDQRAALELVGVANELHFQAGQRTDDYPLLEDWFAKLFKLRFADDCPSGARENLLKSQALAKELFASQQDSVPLHGDLHFDNVRLGSRGFCAFDAKGILGERTYELANAFRHPIALPELVRDPEHVRYLTMLWSSNFNVSAERLMQWAAVKVALSIAWRSPEAISQDSEFDLLDLFLLV